MKQIPTSDQDSAWKEMLNDHFEEFINYKLVDRFGVDVVSLVVVTGKAPGAKLGRYSADRWGCSLVFEYPVVRLADWRGREEELLASRNPFALVTLAQLRLLEARGNIEKRYGAKRELILLLLRRGYERERIESLLRFIIGAADRRDRRGDARTCREIDLETAGSACSGAIGFQ